MEICFIPEGDYAAWRWRRGAAPRREGNFVDADGKILGRHRADTHCYTLG